jgi:hypothetical protein
MSDLPKYRCIGRNPYVGPRPFRQGERLYGREREARGLSDMLIASRIVLLHSPSGAGKTSLIQAAIVPYFHQRGYAINAGGQDSRGFTALRVNEPPPEFQVHNRYVYSTVLGLAGHRVACEELAGTTLVQALDMLGKEPRYRLLVFDQLEEVLTLDPTDRPGREEFFRQLGEALEDEHRWCLLSMREDYMGGLDPYFRLFPGRLRATYRLGSLDREPALLAIVQPAKDSDVIIEDDAAVKLFDDLRTMRIQGPDSEPLPQRGIYVEPVLLQVVCHRLWRKMCKDTDGTFDRVMMSDVDRLGSTDDAIRRYYADVVEEAAGSDRWAQRAIRNWIGSHLITREGFRSQTRTGPSVTGSAEILRSLQNGYLIRSDERAGTTWWELCHDRLVEPILNDNQRWTQLLKPWQQSALRWHENDEQDIYLLSTEDAQQAQRWLTDHDEHATDLERRYVQRSVDRQREMTAVARFTQQTKLLAILLGVSVLLNFLLLVFLLSG